MSIPWRRGFLDGVSVDPCGLIRIEGWWNGVFEQEDLPTVWLDEVQIPFLQPFRFHRPDVPPHSERPSLQAGLVLEYLVPDTLTGTFHTLAISIAGREFRFESSFAFVKPHYKDLFGSDAVWHRSDIYGSGPPNAVVDPEIFELAKRLSPPLLDFGCGKGALMHQLGQLGVEVYGIELFSASLQAAVLPDVSDRITFYDGSFPTHFDDGQFQSVVCSEVLEHIPDYRGAVQEIARITKEHALFTVPDASAIPAGFRHGVVPWHLLEATHVNFFNQTSFTAELRRHFSKVDSGRVGVTSINGTRTFVSLTAICSK